MLKFQSDGFLVTKSPLSRSIKPAKHLVSHMGIACTHRAQRGKSDTTYSGKMGKTQNEY